MASSLYAALNAETEAEPSVYNNLMN